jgi:phenylacetate-CoA ligase
MLTWFSKNLFYPLWDLKDDSMKLKTLKKLETSQWMPEDELRAIQWEKLRKILSYAYENCEYYQEVFDKHNIKPADIVSRNDFTNIPILTKNHIRANADKIISNLYKKENLLFAKTGGSTGKSLTIYFDKTCEEMRNAAAIRSDRWAGWQLGVKKAAIWGNPALADTLKKKIRNLFLDRIIYLDTMNLNQKSMTDFVTSYRKYKPSIIIGHSHSIFMFAKFIQEQHVYDITPKGIIATSMMLVPHERQIIEEVFKCKVTNRYGCEEVGLIACECERHDGMHLNIDHLYIEFIKEDGSPAVTGEEGALVITDLINHGMPLIRYRVEDIGVPGNRKCRCGRGLPLMESVVGRVADFLVRKDGSLVAGVSLIERTLTAISGIEQMQIVQDEINRITLNIVPNAKYDEASNKMLSDEIHNVFGKDLNLKINRMDNIPRESSGKYRFSICNIKRPA